MTRLDLDAHATTPLCAEALDAMMRVYAEANGNPSSAHAQGRQARRYLDEARETVAGVLSVKPGQVTFTSGATEANNLAVLGQVPPGGGLIASRLEHPCVVGPIEWLAARCHPVSWAPVTPDGLFDLDALPTLLTPTTKLVCLMLANHETGVIQPVAELARRLPPGVRLHSDAAQALGKIPVSFPELGVSTLSLSGHKFGGPKGVGAIVTRPDLPVQALFHGGHQQAGLRPGTEPVALAAGLAAALKASITALPGRTLQLKARRAAFLAHLATHAAPVIRHGSPESLPGCLNLAFPGVRADVLLMRLDLMGVSCSAGAACASGSLLPSPVLTAMGVPEAQMRSALRFSFGPQLSEADALDAAHRVADAVRVVRG